MYAVLCTSQCTGCACKSSSLLRGKFPPSLYLHAVCHQSCSWKDGTSPRSHWICRDCCSEMYFLISRQRPPLAQLNSMNFSVIRKYGYWLCYYFWLLIRRLIDNSVHKDRGQERERERERELASSSCYCFFFFTSALDLFTSPYTASEPLHL